MATQSQPLDEVQGRRPDVLQWWADGVEGLPGPFIPMEERMIHRYFSEQVFFDWSTKNGITFSQANTNWDTFTRGHNRKALEAQLRSQPGVEFMIVGEPQQIPNAPPGTKNGMWTIRKQDRSREGRLADGTFPHTETLGTYYIVGENVYQAPSVGDVIGNKLLSASTSLAQFVNQAASLPSFTPTTGHTYAVSDPKVNGAVSTITSPLGSREGSVAPGGDAALLRSGSVAPESRVGTGKPSGTMADARLLAESLRMADEFADEYMDDNPLLGEPGLFRFTTSTRDLKKRKQDEEAAAATARELKDSTSRTVSPKVEKAQSPPPVFSQAKISSNKVEKEKTSEKKKRRKSRLNPNSPMTPGGAAGSATQSFG